MWLTFILVTFIIRSTHGYSAGAPPVACARMTPNHQQDARNLNTTHDLNGHALDLPFKLTTDPPEGSVIAPGQTVQVSLDALNDETFKGFIILVRDSEFPKNSQVGHFEKESDNALVNIATCNTGGHSNYITHNSQNGQAKSKSGIKAKWIAPDDFEGSVFFKYSVVLEYSTYYINLEMAPMRVTRSPKDDQKEIIDDSAINFDDSEPIKDTSAILGSTPTEKASTISTAKTTTTISTTATTTTTTTTTATTTTPQPKKLRVPHDHDIFKGCDDTKGCFADPTDCLEKQKNGESACDYVVSYEVDEKIRLKMAGRSEGEYIAVGLSSNAGMGDDLVTACYHDRNNGQVNVQSGYTIGYSYKPFRFPQYELDVIKRETHDGIFFCEVTRPLNIKINETQIRDGDLTNKVYDYNDEYFIFLAHGRWHNSEIQKHSNTPKISSKPLALSSVEVVKAEFNILLRLHGAFMITAWLGSASLGMIVARYFKQTWTSTQCCKKDMWFFVHRTMMVLTWCLNMAAFIMIFKEREWKWSIPIGDNPHAVLGCVTTFLCFIQPIMALMRPHPGTTMRPIFNWLHWFVGNAAQIVAIVTIFYAVELDKAELPQQTDYLLIAFVIFHAIIHLVLSCVMCKSDSRSKYAQTKNGYAMRQMGVNPRHYPEYEELKRDAPGGAIRKFFLAVYIIVGSLVIAALLALVVEAPAEAKLKEAGILP